MASGTFTQMYVQLVFSPKKHCPIVSINHQERVFSFVAGLMNSMGHKSLAVNGMYDHIHIFGGWKPTFSVSDTVKEIKRASTNFIKEEGFLTKFNWQEGYGAFTYSRSQIDRVIKYIMNQREHHKKVSFKSEYIKMLDNFEVEYDPKYLFDFHD
jgi:putative transposase